MHVKFNYQLCYVKGISLWDLLWVHLFGEIFCMQEGVRQSQRFYLYQYQRVLPSELDQKLLIQQQQSEMDLAPSKQDIDLCAWLITIFSIGKTLKMLSENNTNNNGLSNVPCICPFFFILLDGDGPMQYNINIDIDILASGIWLVFVPEFGAELLPSQSDS